ncbi:MAG: 3-dehydroquinate synthase, partial [Nitrospinae bacterium]|nr:3-dehydroquinate synthase [Nitrospinota bacterium]
MEVVNVELKDRSYSIYIGKDLLKEIGQRVKSLIGGKKTVIITNPRINSLYGNILKDYLKGAGFNAYFVDIPDGEGYKTLDTAVEIYDKLIDIKMERESP